MSVRDLPDHPTLSRAFTSKTLTELTTHARMMAQKEKNTLWRMKHLLTKLSGDHTWIPTAMLETPNDLSFFGDGRQEYRAHLIEKHRVAEEAARLEAEEAAKIQAEEDRIEAAVKADQQAEEIDQQEAQKLAPAPADAPPNGSHHQQGNEDHGGDVEMGEVSDEAEQPSLRGGELPNELTEQKRTDESPLPIPQQQDQGTAEPTDNAANPALEISDDAHPQPPAEAEGAPQPEAEADPAEEHDPDTTLVDPEFAAEEGRHSSPPKETSEDAPSRDREAEDVAKDDLEVDGEDADASADAPEPRRMRTRAQAQAAEDEGASRPRSLSSTSNESFIHPYFLPPLSSLPEHDFMLPSPEADETRRLLQLYIQKQEEIVRGADKLYMGLLEADRSRGKVMSWARAEKHVGEMSDGEDWVDEEEWRLDGPLKKGQDEEEEDTVTTSKKTRTRRQ